MPESILGRALRLTWATFSDEFTAADAHAATAREGVHVDIGAFETMLAHLVEDTYDVRERLGEAGKLYRFHLRPRPSRAHGSGPTTAPNNVACSPARDSGMGVQVAGDGPGAPVLARGWAVNDEPLGHPAAPVALRARRQASTVSPTLPVFESGPKSFTLAPGAAATVRCVARPQPDGGTSFRIAAPIEGWSTDLQALASAAASRGRHRLPAPVDLVDADGVVLTARVKRGGAGNGINLIFDDEAQLALFPRIGVAFLEAKASALWVHGLESWMAKWFAWATYALTGNRCPCASAAHALGWKTHRLELAADFTGFALSKDDAERFANARGGPELVSSKGWQRRGLAETINIGRRGNHRLALSTHDKTQAIRSKKGTPTGSVYASTWRANGWDGSQNVRRVEARAHGRALHLVPRGGAASDLDLRDPASLLDPKVLGAFWVHATATRTRLVAEPPSPSRRRSRGLPTDPRWIEVQAAGDASSAVRYVQVPREECVRVHHAQRVGRAQEEVERAVGRLVGLHSVEARGLDVETLITAILRGQAFAEECAVAESSLDGWPFPRLQLASRTPSSGET